MPSVSQNLPQNITDKECAPINLRLCQCHKCGLVQFDSIHVSYYKDSTRAGERSKALIELRRKQYKHLIEEYNLCGKKILEVGAGKGGFLKTLKEMREYDIDEYGIEYNQSFVKKGGFFDIAIDHIAYYSIDTLQLLFKNNGFDVLECSSFDRGDM